MKRPFPNSYVVPNAALIAGEYPFDVDEAAARRKLGALLDAGVQTIIDLTTSEDGLDDYGPSLAQFAFGRTVELIRMPVMDLRTPYAGQMVRILDCIDSALATGQAVYVHCWGGVGGTGTVIGCWLVRHGMSGDDALAEVDRLFGTVSESKRRRHPKGSPETTAQRDMVRMWKANDGKQAVVQSRAWEERESEPHEPIGPSDRSRIRGCLLGGALGDALGAPVEFMNVAEIAQRFGRHGPAEMTEAYGRVGAITDDTQMTLWTAEGVLRGIVRGNERGIGGPMSTLPYAYLRWLYTQDGALPSHCEDASVILGNGNADSPSGWLLGVKALHSRRAPGNTCLSALRSPTLGSRESPLNDSKGCGGVMRVAPIAMTGPTELETVWDVACFAAALTHGHPTGWVAAGAFAYLLRLLRGGRTLEQSVAATIDRLGNEPHGQETRIALETARRLARAGGPAHPQPIASLGLGWVAEEALAIALYAALKAEGDFEAGVRAAVNHSGDSDSTGSMAGQILGTIVGVEALPARWLAALELRDEIDGIAEDLAIHYRSSGEWWSRYPGY